MSAPFEQFDMHATIRNATDKSSGHIVAIPNSPDTDYQTCADFIYDAIREKLEREREQKK